MDYWAELLEELRTAREQQEATTSQWNTLWEEESDNLSF